MDKLAPIIKQRFWIALGLGLVLTLTGWWLATGAMADTIKTRKDTLTKVASSIPSGDIPNDSWSTQLAEINVRQEQMVANVKRDLWEQQKATMFWHETLREFTDPSVSADATKYRGEFDLVARDLYRTSYPFSVEFVWQKARPIMRDGTGIVLFPLDKMPKRVWGDLAPKSEEIWESQEDLWLLCPILEAIRDVNGGENGTRLDACVHIITKLELMGGERSQGETAGSGGQMSSGSGAEAMMAASGMTSGGGAGAPPKGSADFNVAEEFGTTGLGGSSPNAMAMMSSADAMSGGTQSNAPVVKRYIDDNDSLPYKTRGFYLSVVMDHRKVPHLIGQLEASGTSPWPIEVLRVQVGRVNPDDTEGAMLPGMMAMGAGYGGAGSPYESSGSGAMAADPFAGGSESFSSGDTGIPTGPVPIAPGGLSLEASLQDPFIAKVALCGLIYIYKPVDPPPAAPATEPAATAAPATDPAMEGSTGAPADPAAVPNAPTSPTESPATEGAPAPTTPATPAPATPAPTAPATPAPATPESAKPEAPASPAPPAGTPAAGGTTNP